MMMIYAQTANPLVTTSLPPEQISKIWQAARDFEAMTLGELFKPMFDTVDTAHGLFGGGAGEEAFRPMIINEIARSVANHGGVGLAEPVFRQMLLAQEHAQPDVSWNQEGASDH